jgi:type I restriction enzyme S subunit
MPIIVPPLDRQQHFTRAATAIEDLRRRELLLLRKLDAVFASLQHRAFRGEL